MRNQLATAFLEKKIQKYLISKIEFELLKTSGEELLHKL